MRPIRSFSVIALAGLCVMALFTALSLAAPSISPAPATLIPMGVAQTDVQHAYLDVFARLYAGGRVHWAASALSDPVIRPGDFIIPGGLTTPITHTDVTATLPLSRAFALRAGDVAVLRSTVMITAGQNQYVAMWELADVRQFLDGYLMGRVPYTVLDEPAVVNRLKDFDVLIIPAIRADAIFTMTNVLSETGALAAIRAFAENGGTIIAQSNGAYIAEAASLLPPGTVDLTNTLQLSGADQNRGELVIQQPASPLAWSWLTNTLYILNDPVLHPSGQMQVIATLSNAADAPAIVYAPLSPSGRGAGGEVILIAGHPANDARRAQVPLFIDALLTALAARAEFTGDAIQTFNPDYPAHEFPAYERVPVSATLNVANHWEITLTNVIVTETVQTGYVVSDTSITPAPTMWYTTTSPTATVIVWNFSELAPNSIITLTYEATTEPDVLAAGVGTFATGTLTYLDPERGPIELAHQPFRLTAQMAARLVGDRDLEADRHYRIPALGLYLDLALPLENKEWTLAHNVVVTDWVFLIHPIVDLENQHVILNANDGETIWLRNEPFLWGSKYPTPTNATAPTQTYTLADWQGDQCVFTSTYGIHIDPPGRRPSTDDLGSFVTIPPTYSQYITVTANHELLLPCLPLTFELGEWPGYWYEEPAVRFGVHSRELFSRTVVFHGTPREDTVVMPYDAGSVYVVAGADPVPYREYLTAAAPYVAAAPGLPGVAYQDVWSRTHFMPLRGSFYDVWDWDSCATCGDGRETHAAINLTFGLLGDLDRDGTPETPVREVPTRLAETWFTLMGKSYSSGPAIIPSAENVIELPIFHGLGLQIRPREADWFASFRPATGHTMLISVTATDAYDHLFMQQTIPPGSAEVFYVDGKLLTYDFNREGMFKLHDGARLVYRQPWAGPNRFEVYDSHVHSVIGPSSDGRLASGVGPTAVSVYGDDVYYFFDVSDRYDPRPFTQDPYMNSWGYGDFVATTYVGGRAEKTLLHSIVGSGDRTRTRIALDNNTGVTLTNVSVSILAPAWITATNIYTDPATVPEPIWPELSFLNVTSIPDAWRGVYYFDLTLGTIPTDVVGTVITLPVQLYADGLPAGYEVPPLALAIKTANGGPPDITFGPAHDLTLTQTVPSNVSIEGAAVINQQERDKLLSATDNDATHLLSDTARGVFTSFTQLISFTNSAGVIDFDLPTEWRQLPQTQTLYLAARGTITQANHGPNTISDGGTICYTDSFGMRWCEAASALIIEATGAAVRVDYFCQGGSTGVITDGVSHCTVPPDQTSTLNLKVTAYNEGDKTAQSVTTTLQLPPGVTPINPVADLNWGDLAPGAWSSKAISVEVQPQASAIVAGPSGWQWPIVLRTTGQFTDTASQQRISGQFGGAYSINVKWKPHYAYLPVLYRNYDARPDLIIEALMVNASNSAAVQVRIANRGRGVARAGFWLDLYLDPSEPPTVNHPWETLSFYGLAWQVDHDLLPGQVLTLTLPATTGRWPAIYPGGAHTVWAYADAWSSPEPIGWVAETREDNNVFGPMSFTSGQASPAWLPLLSIDLPDTRH